MQGNELPEGLDLPSQMAYISLRGIYAQYHARIISRDQAAAEKGKIRREYERLEKEWAFGEKLATQRAAILRGTELAKTACRTNPTPENAVRLCNVLDGLEEIV